MSEQQITDDEGVRQERKLTDGKTYSHAPILMRQTSSVVGSRRASEAASARSRLTNSGAIAKQRVSYGAKYCTAQYGMGMTALSVLRDRASRPAVQSSAG
jgi:hypothetical protein